MLVQRVVESILLVWVSNIFFLNVNYFQLYVVVLSLFGTAFKGMFLVVRSSKLIKQDLRWANNMTKTLILL